MKKQIFIHICCVLLLFTNAFAKSGKGVGRLEADARGALRRLGDPGQLPRRERIRRPVHDREALEVDDDQLRAQPELYRNGNVPMRYRQGSDFYYLTGMEEADAIAMLCPGDEEAPFTLFVRPIDPKITLWTGETVGLDRARAVYGADEAPLAQDCCGWYLVDPVFSGDFTFFQEFITG